MLLAYLFATLVGLYYLFQYSKLKRENDGLRLVYQKVSTDYVKYNRENQTLRKRNTELLLQLSKQEVISNVKN